MDSPNGTLYYSEKVSKALQGVTPPPEFESSAFGIYQSLFRWLFLGGEELSENEKHSLLETERIEHSLGEGIRWVTEKGKNVCAVYGGLIVTVSHNPPYALKANAVASAPRLSGFYSNKVSGPLEGCTLKDAQEFVANTSQLFSTRRGGFVRYHLDACEMRYTFDSEGKLFTIQQLGDQWYLRNNLLHVARGARMVHVSENPTTSCEKESPFYGVGRVVRGEWPDHSAVLIPVDEEDIVCI